MNTFRGWLVSCLLLPIYTSIHAQQPAIASEYACRHYTTQDGLPKMYTECLFQDSNGFIWIGTLNGLVRYDGFAFEAFAGTKNAEITALRESAQKNVMAFGFDAYYIFDYAKETFIQKPYPEKLHFNELSSRLLPKGYAMFNRIDGNRENKVLCRIENEEIEPLFEDPVLDGMINNNCALFDAEEETLYLPCDADSTVKIVTLNGKRLLTQQLIRPYSVFRHHETIYCIAESGVYRWQNGRFEFFIPHHFPVAYSFVKTSIA